MKWAPMLSPKAKGLDGQKIRPHSPNLRGILGEDFFRIAVLTKSRRDRWAMGEPPMTACNGVACLSRHRADFCMDVMVPQRVAVKRLNSAE